MDMMDAEELAIAVLKLDEETSDSDKIEQAIFNKFDCSFEQFHKIAEALMPFTIPANVALSSDVYCGFVKDGAFIAKLRVYKPPREIVKWNFPKVPNV